MDKTLCFVFLGEFGYELLDWQGKIRELGQRSGYKIGIASRSNCELLYRDVADFYIPIELSPDYFNSKAHSYFAHNRDYQPTLGNINKVLDSFNAWRRRKRIASFVRQNCTAKNVRFVFSDQLNCIAGLTFGAQRNRLEAFPRKMQYPSIYTDYILSGNCYVNLRDQINKNELKKFQKLAKSSELLIVVQRAERELVVRNNTRLDEEEILESLSRYGRIILLEYKPSRMLDTAGIFDSKFGYERITFDSLAEQVSVLIHADVCLSLSHGDFRSHNYIAPFIGKVGYSVAPFEILRNSALEIWNEKIFPGKIIPVPTDNLKSSEIASLVISHAMRAEGFNKKFEIN